MKVKIEMMVEISKAAEDYEIESHLRDALTEYTGNDIEFVDCTIEKCLPSLRKFEPGDAGRKLICLESFKASHTNSIAGEVVKNEWYYYAGETYCFESWRPEGVRIDGFFVFNRDANKFAIAK